jgi:hypothetical protein
MKKIFVLMAFFLPLAGVYAQSKSEIREKGIKAVLTHEQRLDRGMDKKYVVTEEKYDDKGRLIEIKDLDRKGTIKIWEQYKYDSDGNIIEEIVLGENGKMKKKTVTRYQDGLRTEKNYFDAAGRLYQRKSYEYQYR